MKKVNVKLFERHDYTIHDDGTITDNPIYTKHSIIKASTKKEEDILRLKYRFFIEYEDPFDWDDFSRKIIVAAEAFWNDIVNTNYFEINEYLFIKYRDFHDNKWLSTMAPSNGVMLAAYYFVSGRIRKLRTLIPLLEKEEQEIVRDNIQFIQSEGGIDKFIAKYS